MTPFLILAAVLILLFEFDYFDDDPHGSPITPLAVPPTESEFSPELQSIAIAQCQT